MGFPAGSDGKTLPAMQKTPGSNTVSERCPGEGNGYPLQYSCLESSMDWGTGGHRESDTIRD